MAGPSTQCTFPVCFRSAFTNQTLLKVIPYMYYLVFICSLTAGVPFTELIATATYVHKTKHSTASVSVDSACANQKLSAVGGKTSP